MNKILKISIVLGILLVSFSVFYFFVIFIPAQEDQKQIRECYMAAEKYDKESRRLLLQQKDYKEEDILEPEYKYNKKLKKCLCSSGYNDFIDDHLLYSMYIVDVYTHKCIYSYSKNITTNKFLMGDEDTFNRVKNVFFDEEYAGRVIKPEWRKLVKGMSNTDVEQILGKPQDIDFNNSSDVDVWLYETGGKLEFAPSFSKDGKLQRWKEPNW